MIAPILSTKLHKPPPRSGLVQRLRLIEGLNEGASSKLILISAPTGYGMSTLARCCLESLDDVFNYEN